MTKFRRPLFTDTVLTFCEHTMRAVRAQLDVELVEFNGEADHVHLLVAHPPTPAPVSAPRMRGHLWSPSYFAVSCGGAPLSIIKQYIDGQARPL